MILLQRSPWQWRPGYLNGLRQPALVGGLYTTAASDNSERCVELPGGIDANALQAAGDERSGVDRLLAILAAAYAALPGSLRYPCFAEAVWKVDADNRGTIALPSLAPMIDRRGAEFCSKVARTLKQYVEMASAGWVPSPGKISASYRSSLKGEKQP
jgi:hypothetical protein